MPVPAIVQKFVDLKHDLTMLKASQAKVMAEIQGLSRQMANWSAFRAGLVALMLLIGTLSCRGTQLQSWVSGISPFEK